MFRPPRCPNRACSNHRNPSRDFFAPHGHYHAKCRAHPVPRFRCRACRKTFSRQTFRMDYRDHKPHLNWPLFDFIVSGVGLRQAARKLPLTRHCTEMKFRKIGRHLRNLNLNLRRPTSAAKALLFDEFETYEDRRNTRPLSVPTLIERKSYFIIWSESAPIRPHGKMSKSRAEAIRREEARFGPRKDKSRRASVRTFSQAKDLMRGHSIVILDTDKKSTYPTIARATFGKERLVHNRTDSRLPRRPWNPLFPINQTEEMLREHLGRLRRKSWLVSKRGWCLNLALQFFMADRNFVRRRFNDDDKSVSAAQILGLVDRRLTVNELLSWRQDWRERSIVPGAVPTYSVESWRAAAA
jgi:transposase-like protein